MKTKKKVFTKNGTLNTFFPNSGEDQKKKVFIKNGTIFSPNLSGHLRSDAHQSQIIVRFADVDHTQTIGGGYNQIIGGDISPHPPRISAPLMPTNIIEW